MPKAALDALKKSQDKKEKSEEADAEDKEKKRNTNENGFLCKRRIDVSEHVDALVIGER